MNLLILYQVKNSFTVRSSVFGIFLFLTISMPATYAQASQSNQQTIKSTEFPAAQVTIVDNGNVSGYSFMIIHEIPEWKAERLGDRMLLRYPDLQSIKIDAVGNSVKMSVLNSINDETLNEIFLHFKFNGYEEL